MDCCSNILRSLVFLVNLAFFGCGAVVTGFGAYLQIQMSTYLDFLGGTNVSSALILIVVGIVIMVIAFFGCCGAVTGNSCMMYTFAVLMTLVLLCELGVGIAILVYKGDVHDIVEGSMREGMDNYGGPEYQGVTDAWDLMQHDFHCCGVTKYSDWGESTWGQNNPLSVPNSCCIEDSQDCGKGQINDPAKIYQDGCFKKFEAFIMDKLAIVGGVGAGIALFQLIGIIVGCCMGKKLREKNMYV